MVANETATETIWQCAMEQSKYWKNVDPKSCEPREGELQCALSAVEYLTLSADFDDMSFSIPGNHSLYIFPLTLTLIAHIS